MSTQKLQAQKLRQDSIFLPDLFITWNLRVFRILDAEKRANSETTRRFIIRHLGKPRLWKGDDKDARWQYEVYEIQYGQIYPFPDIKGYIGQQRWIAEELPNFFRRPIK